MFPSQSPSTGRYPMTNRCALPSDFESEIPSEIFLCGVTGLNAVPLQFVYNVLRRIISERVTETK